MKISTTISTTKNNRHVIRGHDLVDLIAKHSFTDVIFLLWRGDLPSHQEATMLEKVLVAAVEHGVSVPSIYVPRVTASVGNPMHVALASGMLAIGTNHGGAIQAAGKLFASSERVVDLVERHGAAHSPIPGFGHRIYKTKDPRAHALLAQAKKLKISTTYFERAYAIEKELKKRKGKKIPLNIDGAMAAALLDLGFNWKVGEAAFLLARLVGMAAHVQEEQDQKNPYYRLEA